jgi:F-type H+-transporting ATPase subunit epsilon
MVHLIKVDIVDAEKQIFSGDAEYLVAPALEGEVGVYPHHVPFISKLKPGVLRVKLADDEVLVFALSGGYIEVKNNHINVLADIVERTEALDEARLNEQKLAAESKLKHLSTDSAHGVDRRNAEIALEIAIAQLKSLEYLRTHKAK